MEAFALLQIEKKNKLMKQQEELERQKIIDRTIKPHTRPLSVQESKKLNRSLGQCIPPDGVYAIGRDSSAAVWWTRSPDDSMVTAWEVHRYRKDMHQWNYKGSVRVEVIDMDAVNQTIVPHLNNDKEYKFTVKGWNDQGPSTESSQSNPVMVERPMPSGWYRFYCENHLRFYYANIRLQRSSWTRPELDAFYLEESVLMIFREHELRHLRSLYQEEMAHFRSVQLDRMGDVFMECGERVGQRRLRQLFLAYSSETETKLLSWKEFMDVVTHVKKDLTSPNTVTAGVISAPAVLFNSLNHGYIANLLGAGHQKMGEWELVPCQLGQRKYYHNTTTKERQWDMPDAVRFYIPDKLLKELLVVFDYGHLENFRNQFSMIDVDHSGDITEVELKLLLKSMGLEVTDSTVHRLVKTIDLNGNGTIEFDEFCYMMYCLRNRHLGERSADPGVSASIWRELDITGVRADAAHLQSKEEIAESLPPASSTAFSPALRVRRGQLGEDDVDDNSVNGSPRSVQSRSSIHSKTSIAESIRGIKSAVFSLGTLPPIRDGGEGDDSPNREFTPTDADDRRDLGRALFAMSEGHFVASRAVQEAEHLLPVEGLVAGDMTPMRVQVPGGIDSRAHSRTNSEYGDDYHSPNHVEGGGSVRSGIARRSRANSSQGEGGSGAATPQAGLPAGVRPLVVARTNSMTWGDLPDGAEHGLALNTANLNRLGEVRKVPPPVSNGAVSVSETSGEPGPAVGGAVGAGSADNSRLDYSFSSPVGKPHQQPEWVKVARTNSFVGLGSPGNSAKNTPANSRPGSPSKASMSSPKGRLHRALSWVDEASSPDNTSGAVTPSVKAMQRIRVAGSRVSSAAQDFSRTAKEAVGSAVKVFTSQTVELQRTLAIAAGVDRPDGYIDDTTGEVHNGYCFCGCRRK